MLQHLYMLDYSGSEIEVAGEKEECFVSELYTHVMMYAMGDEYDIKDLRKEALWKFDWAMKTLHGQRQFKSVLEVVPAIYATTLDSDRGLRDLVVAFGALNLQRIHHMPELKDAGTQAPDYMIEVLPEFFDVLRAQANKYWYTEECPRCYSNYWKFDRVVCERCGTNEKLLPEEMVPTRL